MCVRLFIHNLLHEISSDTTDTQDINRISQVAYLFLLNYLMKSKALSHDYMGTFKMPFVPDDCRVDDQSFAICAENGERLNQLIWLIRILLVCGVVGIIALGISQTK